jgi:hypothetical protein
MDEAALPDDWYNDMPSADPAIRKEYEAALGRFILAFNEVDYRLSQVIAAELSMRGDSKLIATAAKGSFAQRLEKLELLMSAAKSPQFAALPVAKLWSLNGARNDLAHGHFDQNPYDGSYRLTLAAKSRDYPVSRILKLVEDLAHVVLALNNTEILYDFDNFTIEGGGNEVSQI